MRSEDWLKLNHRQRQRNIYIPAYLYYKIASLCVEPGMECDALAHELRLKLEPFLEEIFKEILKEIPE